MKIGIVGLGFVGTAMMQSFVKKNVEVLTYDTNKECNSDLNMILKTDIVFLCLPTEYCSKQKQYDKTAIYKTCDILQHERYSGAVVCKSTIEPGSIDALSSKYDKLNIIHNPEFLTARTATRDYHNQKHIVLGKSSDCDPRVLDEVVSFHAENYPDANITLCTSLESECTKIFANTFYSVKVQFFTELFLLCEAIDCNYSKVRNIMINNGWINPMHTEVPGPDGEISYGGMCFPKDTRALLEFMKTEEIPHQVLESCINERDTMRTDHVNCK
jgi:UDPglucose 6-dehydrogenase